MKLCRPFLLVIRHQCLARLHYDSSTSNVPVRLAISQMNQDFNNAPVFWAWFIIPHLFGKVFNCLPEIFCSLAVLLNFLASLLSIHWQCSGFPNCFQDLLTLYRLSISG